MSALCCAVPSLMATGGGVNTSSMPVVYHHFNRPSAMALPQQQNSFMSMELNNSNEYRMQQQQLPCHQPVDQFTTTVYGSSNSQQQFLMPQQQAITSSQQSRASRRKRLEDALTEAIPAASSCKVSQRIAQLQQSLYASCHPVAAGRSVHPSRPLSLDPLKDYSLPLTVDCSIEYDLPRVARPPPGAKPLLLIARRPPPPPTLPAVRESPSRQRQQQWNPVIRTATHQVLLQQSSQQFQFRPDCTGYFVMNVAPVSSSSSEDSGRGTDSEQHPSSPVTSNSYRIATAHHPTNNNWMNASEPQWTSLIRQQQLKYNQHMKPTALPAPQHPRPAGNLDNITRTQRHVGAN
ncbi:centrosomal and chromosomal factor-like isoform X2 [Daphnia carinata]|uniref:centrosomal and chromosomal factor-like isoform X2 n=1 Tax=Daphnia carinata TaxID=120202 RepID=UPI00286957B2|nr:centrosomal and chromosomal factor-like isoform X2 [Daphnia carinata]